MKIWGKNKSPLKVTYVSKHLWPHTTDVAAAPSKNFWLAWASINCLHKCLSDRRILNTNGMFRPRFRQQKRGGRPVAPAARASGILKHFFLGGGEEEGERKKSARIFFFPFSSPDFPGRKWLLFTTISRTHKKEEAKQEGASSTLWLFCLSIFLDDETKGEKRRKVGERLSLRNRAWKDDTISTTTPFFTVGPPTLSCHLSSMYVEEYSRTRTIETEIGRWPNFSSYQSFPFEPSNLTWQGDIFCSLENNRRFLLTEWRGQPSSTVLSITTYLLTVTKCRRTLLGGTAKQFHFPIWPQSPKLR